MSLSSPASCSCCPYGYHIDVDFVCYCEQLLNALNGRCSSGRAKSLSRTFSLPAQSHRNRLRKSSSGDSTDVYWCPNDHNGNQLQQRAITYRLKNQSPIKNHHQLAESYFADNQFGDAVARFEETWTETKKRLPSPPIAFADSPAKLTNKDTNNCDQQSMESPPSSPAPSSCASSAVSKAVLTQIRDQMAVAISRMKELEEQARDLPFLRQKIIVLKEEKKKLMKRIEGDYYENDLEEQKSVSRVRELENNGLITPPMMRRKLLMADEEPEDVEMLTKKSNKKVSSKNIRLDQFDQVSDDQMSLSSGDKSPKSTKEAATDTEPQFADIQIKIQQQNRIINQSSVSIPPEPAPRSIVKTRSIGITTSLAPNLPRRSVSVSTEDIADEVFSRSFFKQMPKPNSVSSGTNPELIQIKDSECEVRPTTAEATTSTDVKESKSVEVDATKPEVKPKTLTRTQQTERKVFSNKIVQVTEKCSKCDLRQTETVAIGDFDVWSEVGLTEKEDKETETFSVNNVCDQCNCQIKEVEEVIKEAPKEPVKELITPPSPVQSRIPRPVIATPEKRRFQDKIIELTPDEVLVYRDPEADSWNGNNGIGSSSDNSSSTTPKPPLPPPRKRDIQKKSTAVDDIFDHLSESDDSRTSSDEEGTYEVETGQVEVKSRSRRQRVDPSQEIGSALKVLNDNLVNPERANKQVLDKSLAIIEKEWFKISAQDESDSQTVEDYLDLFESFSKHLLNRVVNLSDGSGNTAMHYAISHCNFDIVSVLLDSKVCDVNKQNKAGYTAIMLVALAKVEDETQKSVVKRLFQLGDVNIKAKMNGQTALMLAASHGQFATCKLLLESGAAINVQDNDGSTALMCATEHGQDEVVRLLLSHPDCDPTILDNDGSTALRIAMSKGRNDIGLMLYASTSLFSRGSLPYASLRKTQPKNRSENGGSASLRRSLSCSQPANSRTFHLASSPPSRPRHSVVESIDQ